MNIRPFNQTENDYQAIVNIWNRARPNIIVTTTDVQHFDANINPDYAFHRNVIEENGQIIAFGEYRQSPWHYHPEKYSFDMIVDPNHEREGIREAYFAYVQDMLADKNLLAFTARGLEDDTPWMDFLYANNFVETMRGNRSALDTTIFDPAPFAPIVKKVAASGIEILNLVDYPQKDEDWQRNLWELEWALMQDVPQSEAPTKRSLENFISQTLNDPNFQADLWLVAVDDGQCVALTYLWPRKAAVPSAHIGLTGVIRSHRRRGIATALKVASIAATKARGIEQMTTGNEENNPMYQINLKLGFKPLPAMLELEKKLREETHEN